MAHPAGNKRRTVLVADGRSEDGELLDLSEREAAPTNMPMMFTLAAQDACSARGRLFLGSGELKAFANHDPHRTLVGTGHSGDVTEELSLLHSRELLIRAIWAAGLNVTLETHAGLAPVEIVVNRAELPDAVATEQLFEIRLASSTEYVIVRDQVMIGSGTLGRAFDTETLKLLINSRPGVGPQPGATYQLRVSPMQEAIERVLRTLRIQIRSDGTSEHEARTVELNFRDDVPHRAAVFLRELVVAYAERRQGSARTSAFKPPLLTSGSWSGVLPPSGHVWGSSERASAPALDAFAAERPRSRRPKRRVGTLNVCLGVLAIALGTLAIRGAISGPSDTPRPAPSLGAAPASTANASPPATVAPHDPTPPKAIAQPVPSAASEVVPAPAPAAPAVGALEPAQPQVVEQPEPATRRAPSSTGASKKRRAARRDSSAATSRQSEPPAATSDSPTGLPVNPY